MNREVQDAVCAFVREIIAARTGERIEVTDRPELRQRSGEVVEELWESPSRRYSVEHTQLESYPGQLGSQARIARLVVPVRQMLAGRLPGYYVLAVRINETEEARIKYADAHAEIVRLTLDAAPKLKDEETVELRSDRLPFTMQLHRRHGNGSQVVVHCLIDGDGDALRLERVRHAFNEKCPKLAAWSAGGRVSVLVLEANDIQLSNAGVVYQAVRQALAERSDSPDVIVLVETDGGPMYGWVLKEGEHLGDAVPMPNSTRCYTEGQIPINVR